MKKILYFRGLSLKCLFRPIFNEIVENQDLNRDKDDLKKIKTKSSYFLIYKYFIFDKNTCKMYILTDI